MIANCAAVTEGSIQCRTRSRTEPVCSGEKESVDMAKMTTAQSRAGHQARSQAGIKNCTRRGCTSGKCGAERGLRQGWSATRSCSGKWDFVFADTSVRLVQVAPFALARFEILRGKSGGPPAAGRQDRRTPNYSMR